MWAARAGPVRGRHARDRQRHRVRQGAAADAALRRPTPSRARPPRRGRPPRSCATTHSTELSGRELLHELRQTLIGRGVRVPTVEGARPYVNLDNGASTPTFEPIWAAVRQAWRQPAHVQQAVVQEVRSIVADVVGAPPAEYDVIFTSNTTDAINLVAESAGREAGPGTAAGRRQHAPRAQLQRAAVAHGSRRVAGAAADGRRGLRGSGRAGGAACARTTRAASTARRASRWSP